MTQISLGLQICAIAMTEVDKEFKQVQDLWSERLISDEKFCDAVAILGTEGLRVPFIRAYLGALSEPLCAALYGAFKESSACEITLKDVTVEAFDVIQRSSHHLDPRLTPERAVLTLKAANLYLIDGLSSFCLRYLKNLTEIGLQLQALSASLKVPYPLPEELVSNYFTHILLNAQDAVGSQAFVQAHGSIISALIQSDELEIDEEMLWNQLVAWAGNAVRDPQLLGPYAEVASSYMKFGRKDLEQDDNFGSSELLQQTHILQSIFKHMRIAAMSKEFFFDKVRTWLTRADSDAVIGYMWLGREAPEVCLSTREGLPSKNGITVRQCRPDGQTDAIQDLIRGSRIPWMPATVSSYLEVILSQGGCDVDKVVLTFSPTGLLWNSSLHNMNVNLQATASCTEGRKLIFRLMPAWRVPWFHIVPGAEAFRPSTASLIKVTIFTKQMRADLAFEAAGRLSSSVTETKESIW